MSLMKDPVRVCRSLLEREGIKIVQVCACEGNNNDKEDICLLIHACDVMIRSEKTN
jgi:hypothetical protein